MIGLKASESKGMDIILMNLYAQMSDNSARNANSRADFVDDIKERKEISASLAEGDVFSFLDGESNFSLEFALPENGTPNNEDEVLITAMGAMRVIESDKVHVEKAVNAKIGSGRQDETVFSSPFNIMPNTILRNNMF